MQHIHKHTPDGPPRALHQVHLCSPIFVELDLVRWRTQAHAPVVLRCLLLDNVRQQTILDNISYLLFF